MSDDNDLYDLRITFRVKLKKWRIDSPNINGSDWCLKVYDRNLEEWVVTTKSGLNRPGEEAYIEKRETIRG
jgi:hypothetical protein